MPSIYSDHSFKRGMISFHEHLIKGRAQPLAVHYVRRTLRLDVTSFNSIGSRDQWGVLVTFLDLEITTLDAITSWIVASSETERCRTRSDALQLHHAVQAMLTWLGHDVRTAYAR